MDQISECGLRIFVNRGSRPKPNLQPKLLCACLKPSSKKITAKRVNWYLFAVRSNLNPDTKENYMNLKIIIENGEDGFFVAHCPSLKSCWSQGKTREEALTNIREAIDLYLEPSPEDFVGKQEVVELTV